MIVFIEFEDPIDYPYTIPAELIGLVAAQGIVKKHALQFIGKDCIRQSLL